MFLAAQSRGCTVTQRNFSRRTRVAEKSWFSAWPVLLAGAPRDARGSKKEGLTLPETPLPHRADRLFIVTVVLRSTLIRSREEAEKTVRLVADAGGEEQPIARSSTLAVAKA
jgi:hypothetical protein